MKKSTAIISTLSVGLAGLLAGIYFAPDKSSKIRRKIAHTGRDFRDSFLDGIDDISDSITPAIEKMEKKTGHIAKKALKKAEKAKAEAEASVR